MSTTTQHPGPPAEVGVVGLAVMGSNLARNIARRGHVVAVHNRTWAKTDSLLADHGSEGTFVAARTVEDLVTSLERPRKIILMVQAGAPTDATIDALVPLLEPGDILVDGGNAHFEDTQRREDRLRSTGIQFVGTGISGGEEGALLGPSIMPGGSAEAYAAIGPLLEEISAKVDGDPCCTHVGPDGAGHFVKMVHNGIEYADMQFIAEAYDLLRAAGLDAHQIAAAFREWNTGDLDSYLIEITSEVLDQVDATTGKPLVEVIADAAEQKGTGRWTVQSALELGVPVNVIAESVFARSTSGHSALRLAAREALSSAESRGVGGAGSSALGDAPATIDAPATVGDAQAASDDVPPLVDDVPAFVDDVRAALWSAKVVAYAQGLDQIRTASAAYDWGVDVSAVARIWRGGCIIRARLLERIRQEYAAENLVTLLAAPSVSAELARTQDAWRRVVSRAVTAGVPVPGFSAALAYLDTVRRDRLPAALVQGLRDYFGAHTYRRTDRSGTFHTLWSGDRSEVAL